MSVMKPMTAWVIPVLAMACIGGHARADEHMMLVSTIDVGGKGLSTFDISFVDPKLDLYVLADRTNASIDFFDASDATFIARVPGFAGQKFKADGTTADNTISGPDGVTIVNNSEAWAGDGDSTVKVIDINSFSIVDTIPVTDPTNPNVKLRCDEMAWDSADHILAVANNANTPPFVTMINTDTHKILGQIVFNGKNGTPDATNTGIEQPQWSQKTGLFYVSVPQIFPSDATQGGVAVIDPTSMSVTKVYPVSNCTPAGLAIGPRNEAMLGCSASFGTSPNIISQSVVMSLVNGDIKANITQAGGNDEVWYDKGTGHYYLSARATTTPTGTVTPITGTVDAVSNVYDGGVPTSTSAHSLAADSRSHHLFVPIGSAATLAADPSNPCPDVTKGCIAVYLPSSIDDDDFAKQGRR